MRGIPTVLILLPLLMAMLTFFVRFYRLNPQENIRNPNFIAATVCVLLMLTYTLGINVVMGGSAIASIIWFVAAIVMAIAAIRALMRTRGRV